MRTRTAIVAAAALLAGSCGGEPPAGPPFRTDNTVQMLMANMLDPAADLLWDAVGTILDENGETYWEPETEEDWLQVKLGAVALAESANLLIMEGRARDQDQWIRMSEAMADAAMLAFDAGRGRGPSADIRSRRGRLRDVQQLPHPVLGGRRGPGPRHRAGGLSPGGGREPAGGRAAGGRLWPRRRRPALAAPQAAGSGRAAGGRLWPRRRRPAPE